MIGLLNKIISPTGFSVIQKRQANTLPVDFTSLHTEIWNMAHPFTMTSPERIFALIEAVQYIERHHIEGSIVECGVWKGGSMVAAIETLKKVGNLSRTLYLYDTYEGMSEPTADDLDHAKNDAKTLLQNRKKTEDDQIWAYSPLSAVQKNLLSTRYPADQIHFIKGKVEETIPGTIPERIALLRLDTDWYESTKHELEHLYPLLSKGGILIIDDYGHWAGARKAVDEFFSKQTEPYLLQRIDDTGRILIKQH